MGEGANQMNPYDNTINDTSREQVRFVGFDNDNNQVENEPKQVKLAVHADNGDAETLDDINQRTEVIRSDIDQTRSEMSQTLDAIQQKLNPQQLMDQAKATVMETATDLIDHAKDTAIEAVDHVKEAAVEAVDHTKQTVHDATVGKVEHMVSNITDTAQETGSGIVGMIKSNPLPAALVGIGLGWMFMKNQNKNPATKSHGQGYYAPTPPSYETTPAYDYTSRLRAAKPYNDTNLYSPDNSFNKPVGNSEGLLNRVVETIQQNPIPAALTGLSIGYIVMQGQGSKGQSDVRSSYGYQYKQQGNVGQKVGDVASQAGDVVGNITQKAGNLVDQASGKVGDITGGVAEGVGNVAGGVASGIGDTLGGVGNTVGGVASGIGDTFGGVVEGVQYQTLRAETTFGRMLEEKPLAVGAVALALGITAGLLLPNTPQENQILGAAHDNLLEKVQETTQQTFEKVQHVTEEVGNTTKSAIQDISDTAAHQAHEQGLIR